MLRFMTTHSRPKTVALAFMAMLATFGLEGAPQETDARPLDFKGFDGKARAGENLCVVFFGGSLTWGAQATDPQLTSYRARIANIITHTYPRAHFTFWDAGLGGTGSQLGAFRLDRDVMSRKPNLVFLDFTVNDGPFETPNPDKLASYESLVRRLVFAGIPVVPVIFAVKSDALPNQPRRPLDEKHKEIARAYHLPVGDAVALLRKRVREGTATPDILWPMPGDNTHPGDDGYALYAEAAWSAYQEAVQLDMKGKAPKEMLHAATYMTVNRQRLASFSALPSGWRRGQPSRSAISYDFIPSRWMDSVVVAAASVSQPEPLKLKIRAQSALLYGEATPQAGKYQVRIDGGGGKTYDSGAMTKNGNARYVQIIAEGLDSNQEHRIEITPQLEAGQELRLESICVAGAPATVSLEAKP